MLYTVLPDIVFVNHSVIQNLFLKTWKLLETELWICSLRVMKLVNVEFDFVLS